MGFSISWLELLVTTWVCLAGGPFSYGQLLVICFRIRTSYLCGLACWAWALEIRFIRCHSKGVLEWLVDGSEGLSGPQSCLQR